MSIYFWRYGKIQILKKHKFAYNDFTNYKLCQVFFFVQNLQDFIDGPNYEIPEMIMTSLKYINTPETSLVFINVLFIYACTSTLFKIKMDGVFLWRWRIFVTVLLKVFLRNLSFASTTTPTGE